MAWIVLGVFVMCAVLMYRKVLSALVALPLMALLIALAAMSNDPVNALGLVFGKGTTRLAGAMSNAVFGAILAHVVQVCGIGEAIVKRAAEFSGDHPLPVALIMTAATAAAFTSLTGLGAAIMVGTVALPILIGAGFRPVHAAGMFLFGVSIGGLWNIAGWGLYRDVLSVDVAVIMRLAVICSSSMAIATLIYILLAVRTAAAGWTAPRVGERPRRSTVPGYALLAPVVPIVLMLGSKYAGIITFGAIHPRDMDINAALAAGVIYAILTTRPREFLTTLTASTVEGIRTVAPVLFLMMGIGMTVTVLMSPEVTSAVSPLLQAALPKNKLLLALFFAVLSPAALYRGPLNLYGLGAGVGSILKTLIGGPTAGAALMGSGIVQGVSDPTNTHNAWTGGFVRVDVNDILRSTLPFSWAAAAAALVTIALTQ